MKPFRILEDTTPHRHGWERIPTQSVIGDMIGDLWFPELRGEPYFIRNDAVTDDGVMALASHPGPAVITGSPVHDLFVVALLRNIASGVLIGANTLAQESEHLWIPREMLNIAQLSSGPFVRMFAEMREEMSLPEHPTLVVLTRSGALPEDARVYHETDIPLVVCTTIEGAARLPESVRSRAQTTIVRYDGVHVAQLIPEFVRLGLGRIVVEAGPAVSSELMREQMIHEEWTTICPRILGMGEGRSARVMHAFTPGSEPVTQLLSLRLASWEIERGGRKHDLPFVFTRRQILY